MASVLMPVPRKYPVPVPRAEMILDL